jgi:hypothetical protein
VVALGGIERAHRLDLGDDRPPERLQGVELGDIGGRDPLLLGARGEDLGAVLRALVGSLPIELGRVSLTKSHSRPKWFKIHVIVSVRFWLRQLTR